MRCLAQPHPQHLQKLRFFRWPSAIWEAELQEGSTHYIPRFEILLWAVWMRIVTTDTGLGNRFIRIECLEDGSPALGRHASIGTIGVHEDLRQPGSLNSVVGLFFLFIAQLLINRNRIPLGCSATSRPASIKNWAGRGEPGGLLSNFPRRRQCLASASAPQRQWCKTFDLPGSHYAHSWRQIRRVYTWADLSPCLWQREPPDRAGMLRLFRQRA